MMAQEEILEEPVKEAQIQHEEELREINLGAELGSQKLVFISSQLTAQEREQLVPGLDPGLVVHSLNVDPGVKPVVQPVMVFHTEVEAQIIQEVKKLLTVGFIKPIQHPKWFSNIVPVKKKKG